MDNDNQSPDVTCPAPVTSSTTAVDFALNVTDNADPSPTVTYDPLGPSDDFPDNETTVVNVTVMDASGNSASCSFTVTVELPTTMPMAATTVNSPVTTMAEMKTASQTTTTRTTTTSSNSGSRSGSGSDGSNSGSDSESNSGSGSESNSGSSSDSESSSGSNSSR